MDGDSIAAIGGVITALTALVAAITGAIAAFKANGAKKVANEAADIGAGNSQQIAEVHKEVKEQGAQTRRSITPIADTLTPQEPEKVPSVPTRRKARS